MNKYVPVLMRIFSVISAITMIVLLIMYIKSGDIGKSYSEYPFYIIVSFVSTGHFLALSKLTDNK